jgi:hypothetical protein
MMGFLQGLLGWKSHALVAVLAAALAVSATWAARDLVWSAKLADAERDHATAMAAVSNAAATQLTDNLKWMKALGAKLSALDLKGFQEFIDVQTERERLAADIASGNRRLWVRIRLPAGGDGTGFRAPATRMGHATALAELDPAFAGSLLGITRDGDIGVAQLNGCQDYAAAVSAPRR